MLFHIDRKIVWPCDFPQATGRAADRRQNFIRFSLSVRQPYDARTIVLRLREGLSPAARLSQMRQRDCHANFMGCRMVSRMQEIKIVPSREVYGCCEIDVKQALHI